ncbi:MAG: hypothetical protein UHK60_06160 [Acutalibacteraceae bacterium]|nr:hypothetical protein [Acutalibacteraceae bacterium]
MKKIIYSMVLLLYIISVLCISGCESTAKITNVEEATETTKQNQEETQPIATEQETKTDFDVTAAYANKPYTNELALERIDELQYIDDESLYKLCSIDESPIFYDGFFYENNTFNVTLDTYEYDMDNEIVRKYFDTYEYSKFASIGALRVIDSFVYDDVDNNKMIYYCYYTTTRWSEDETLDTMDYYRDVITVNKKDCSITLQEKVAMVTNLEVPKEITGDHDFHGVI